MLELKTFLEKSLIGAFVLSPWAGIGSCFWLLESCPSNVPDTHTLPATPGVGTHRSTFLLAVTPVEQSFTCLTC